MIQTFDTQLEVSLRALREVVAPALENAESHVVEQFNLALATLDFTRQRLPYARSFHRSELQHFMEFSADVREVIDADRPDIAQQLKNTEEEGSKQLASPEAEVEDYLMVSRQLRELIAEATQCSNGKPYEKQLDTLILQRQKDFFPAQRSWCQPLVLDTKPDELPTMDDAISGAY